VRIITLTHKPNDANIVKQGRVISMPEIEIKKDESFEAALRRFKKKIEQEGILREVRDRKHYEKPSERKRKKTRGRR
jgi:small subunit ribosomal protein S21